eukprot:UN32016
MCFQAVSIASINVKTVQLGLPLKCNLFRPIFHICCKHLPLRQQASYVISLQLYKRLHQHKARPSYTQKVSILFPIQHQILSRIEVLQGIQHKDIWLRCSLECTRDFLTDRCQVHLLSDMNL